MIASRMSEIATSRGGPNTLPTLAATEWSFPPSAFQVEDNQVHVWRAVLPEFCGELATFQSRLAPGELARAARFRFSTDREAFIIRHGILRSILGGYLKRPAGELQFRYSNFGKPEINCGSGAPVYFNASSSGDIALFAISSSGPVGIDVEAVRPIAQMETFASRFFTVRETTTLLSLPHDSQRQGFYTCWTRKEAFLKATGEGISMALSDVEVMLGPDREDSVLRHGKHGPNQTDWHLRSFSPAPGYLAAVAFERRDLTPIHWAVPASIASSMLEP